MRIAIVGTGAVGGYYGGRLAQHGRDVHFLLRGDYEHVRKHGLTVNSLGKEIRLPYVQAYHDAGEIGVVDLVMIALKTTANDSLAELLKPLYGENTLFLTVQNGLGNTEKLAELFPERHIAGGLAFICANRTGPGYIEHLDYGQLNIGNYGRGADERLHRVGHIFNRCDVPCELFDNLELAQWKKLVWNIPFNGLSALLDKSVDEIVNSPPLRRRVVVIMREVQAGAESQGLHIPDSFLDKMMEASDKMKPYLTSMQLDGREGKGLEVESIIGEPLRRAQAENLELPEIELLYGELKTLDATLRHETTG